MTMELDVSKKIRTAIKAKLLELGVHVDEELPDYIMILIANRRSKVQMDEDLSLFLGDNTLKFTNWLHQVLKKLQEVTTVIPTSDNKPAARRPSESNPPAKKPEDKQPPPKEQKSVETKDSVDSVLPEVSKFEDKPVNKRKHDAVDPAQPPPAAKVTVEEGTKSPVVKKLKVSRKPIEIETKDEPTKTPSKTSSDDAKRVVKAPTIVSKVVAVVTRKDSSGESQAKKPKEFGKGVGSRSPVVAPSRSPLTTKRNRSRSPIRIDRSPVSYRRDRSPSPGGYARKRRQSDRERSRSPIKITRKPVRSSAVSKSKSRSPSPASRARKSLRSLVAVVKRHNELNAAKDEEYNPAHPEVTPAVASAIHVTPRPKRVSKPEGSGSNKLLFRALADAQKSIVTHAINSKVVASDGDKGKSVNESAEGRKNDVSKRIVRKSNETGRLRRSDDEFKIDEGSRKAKEREPVAKPSIKERLGYRLGSRVQEPRNYEEDLPPYEDLEGELDDDLQSDYLSGSQDNYKSIIIKVPTSKDSKERNVTLEESKRQTVAEEPKRLSIQVNVHSDDSTTSEDELEIQPRASEELNLEPEDAVETGKVDEVASTGRDEVEPQEPSGNSKAPSEKSGSSRKEMEPSETKDLDLLDETSKHSEEVEIEEYEEVEEEDDDEYEVVIQERNFALPDPDEYAKDRGNSNTVENGQSMEVTENSKSQEKLSDVEMDESNAYIPESPRYPLNSKSMNQREALVYTPKFVVTMVGTEDQYEEEMNEETYEDNSYQVDLRHRIGTRSVVPPKGPSPHYGPKFTFNPNARPFLPISGTPRPYLTPGSSTGPSCKYWPDCSFKDKCIYPHPKCKYGESCTKPDCPYKHERVQTFPNSNETKTPDGDGGKVVCKFFPKCHSMSCQFYHPSPCRFGVGCTDAKCKNFHPSQTVGQLRAKNKMFTAVGGRANYRAPPPAAHLLRWKAPTSALLDEKRDENQDSPPASSVPATSV